MGRNNRKHQRKKAALPSYWEVLTRALNDIARHGYDSEERITFWSEEIRRAAERAMRSDAEVERMVKMAMATVFRRLVERGGVLQTQPGVQAYTLERVRPELHAELNRRIAAGVNLIRLNRKEAIFKTQQRFRGWATAVPAGGSQTLQHRQQKQVLRQSLARLPFTERRVVIDQTHKLIAAINDTVASNGGAIGALWQSHKYQAGYDGRPAHNARDGEFFLLRGSWADQAGYVRPGGHLYMDQVEQPAQLPFCRCHWVYRFTLRAIPTECLTGKGHEALGKARAAMAASRTPSLTR